MLVTDLQPFIRQNQILWMNLIAIRYYLCPLDIRPHQEKNEFIVYILKTKNRLWTPEGFVYYSFDNISGIAITKDIIRQYKSLKKSPKNKFSSKNKKQLLNLLKTMLLRLIATNITIMFIGYGPVKFALKEHRLPLLANLSFSFGAGIGFITLWMFLLQILGINWSIDVIAYPLLLPTIFYTIKSSYSHRRIIGKDSQENSSLIENMTTAIVLSYAVFMIGSVMIRALLTPLYHWDALSFIGYKGKLFFYQKGLGSLASLPHRAYPLHIPLSLVWEALWLGEWHDAFIKIIFPLCYAALLGAHYFFLKNYTSRL